MEEWKEYKLGEVCKSIADGDHMPPPKTDKGIPFVTISNIVGNRLDFANTHFVPQSYYDDLDDKRRPHIGDTIYSVVGTFGKPVYVNEEKPFVFQRHIAILRPDNSMIVPQFLFYTLLSPQFYRKADVMAIGAVQRTISLTSLRNVTIQLPPLDIQSKIVGMLSSLDNKIEVNRRINENLEQQAQALFKSWFVDFEPFKNQPFVESELGMIPQGWKVVTLSDACAKVTDGSHYSPKDDPFGTIPMLSVKDMLHNGFDYSSCKKINEEEYEKMKANDCVPRVNDILVAKDGSYLKEIFMCNEEIKQAILSSIAIFRSNIDVIFPELLLQLLRLPKVKKDVGDNYVSGSALPRIVLKDFKKFKFVVAPIDIQKEIIETLKSINIRIHINEKESRRLAELRDTLLPRLMSGELKVNDLENNEI